MTGENKNESLYYTKRLLYSVLILALCTICLFVSTLAWFSINRKTKTSGMSVTIGGLEVEYTMQIYKNGDTSAPVDYSDLFSGMIPGEFYTFKISLYKTEPHALDLRITLRSIEDEEITFTDQNGDVINTGKYSSQLFKARLVEVNGAEYDEISSTVDGAFLREFKENEFKNLVVIPDWSEDNTITVTFEIKLIEDYNDPQGLNLHPSMISNKHTSIGHVLLYGFKLND